MSAFQPSGNSGADSRIQRLELGGVLSCGECGYERAVDNEILSRFPMQEKSYLREFSDLGKFRCSKCGARGTVRYVPHDEVLLRRSPEPGTVGFGELTPDEEYARQIRIRRTLLDRERASRPVPAAEAHSSSSFHASCHQCGGDGGAGGRCPNCGGNGLEP